MALKKYVKDEVKVRKEPINKKTLVITPDIPKKKMSAWESLRSTYYEFLDYLTISKAAGLIIPLVLIFAGGAILFDQLWPEFEQAVREREGYLDQGNIPVVEGDFIEERQIYLSNPGSSYFKELSETAFSQNTLPEDPLSNQYNGSFQISIPSLDLNNLPVQANVESGVEEVYDRVLETSLAHFKGTGLPISDVRNNIVIYGHSANGGYYERTQDPAGAFTRLQNVKIGDEIEIKMEGKTYKYKINKTKIVNPDEISIITGTPNRRTLTLFTCFPNGNSANRLVVVAKPIN